MSTQMTQEILVTTPETPPPSIAWLRPYRHHVVPPEELPSIQHLPPITVVQAKAPSSLARHRRFLDVLSSRAKESHEPFKILVVFSVSAQPKARDFARVLDRFPVEAVEFVRGHRNGPFALEEVFAKLLKKIGEGPRREQARPRDPLGEIQGVVKATADLRTGAGRLSAALVADAFGLAVAELSKILGKTRQAVSKTPDAASLQGGLHQFERIARLKAVLPSDDFKKWLNMPRPEMDGLSPLEVVREGNASKVADFVEHMLTGVPV